MKNLLLIALALTAWACSDSDQSKPATEAGEPKSTVDLDDPKRVAERLAVTSASHPYAGFWKRTNCDGNVGIAIASAGDNLYSLSFCGDGGCFEPGTYRPNSPIVGDPDYRIVDDNTIEISQHSGGFAAYVRCAGRENE